MSYTNRQIDTYLTLQEFTMQVSIAEVKLMTILILSKMISIPIIKDCSQDACGRGQSIEQTTITSRNLIKTIEWIIRFYIRICVIILRL